MRDYSNGSLGISLMVPDGYVLATSPAQAAARFPALLGNDAGSTAKIMDAQARLAGSALLVAFRAPVDGASDNVSLLRSKGHAPDIQSSGVRTQLQTSLTGAKATDIQFADATIDGQPAERVQYSILSPGGRALTGVQYYVPHRQDVLILTVSASRAADATSTSDSIVRTWRLS